MELAQYYSERKDYSKANSWIEKSALSNSGTYLKSQIQELQYEIYQKLNLPTKIAQILFEIYQNSPSLTTFQKYLDVLAEKEKSLFIDSQHMNIIGEPDFSYSKLQILLEYTPEIEAENYALRRLDQLDGARYIAELKIAKIAEEKQMFLLATTFYRNLLDSILFRGFTKAYSSGVKYLIKLDELSFLIQDWKNLGSHIKYKTDVLTVHKQKRTFWEKYNS